MSVSSLWDQQGRRGAWERNQVIFQLHFTHFWSFLHADLFLWNKHFQPKSIVSVHKTWYKQKTPLTTDPRHWTAFSPNLLLHPVCLSIRNRSGDRSLQCNRSRAADVSSRTAHPHQKKEPRGLVGGRAAGIPAQSLLICHDFIQI